MAEFVELTDGVYAYIQEGGGWFISNAGLIVGEKYAVVIDSLYNELAARDFIEKIREVTAKPVKILVNTHGHPDHVWTNHMFDAVTICHENARRETMTAFVELYQSLFPDLDFTGAKITPQDLTFTKSITLQPEIRVVHPGVAHTTGDVYIQRSNIVFCGDLLFAKPCTPLALAGSIRGYIKAIEELISLNAEYYVPGHGNVASIDELIEAKEYLEYVYDEAKKRMERGMGWYEAVLDIDLGKYAEWREKERIVGNVARAYAELQNREMEFQEMVEAARKMLEHR